ncbi:Cytochrome P450 3A4 [Branchiostoma belcheri]|nr:Cytochrome P450 3A4 [Branchiostoma belcheri]
MSSMVDLLPLSPTWVLLGVCLLLYYLYLTWPFNKFKKLGIPGPKPVLNFGNLLKYSEGSHAFDMECYKKYGKVCGIFEGRRPVLMIGDLGLIKEITVKQFHKFNNRMDLGSILEPFAGSLFVIRDADWKRVRSAITPTLSSGKLKQMSMLVEKCADGLVSSLQEKQEKGIMFDMKDTAFGMDIDSLHNPDHPFVTHAKAIFDMNMLKVYAYILVPPPFNNIFTIGGLSFFPKFATDFFKHTIEKAIKTREGSMDDTAHNKHRDETTGELTGVGYDTTANTIALTAYNLAFNQEAQDRVMEEVDTVVQNRGKLDYETGHELRYLEMCVNETLRIYPGAKRFDRVCREDADINGLRIPAGTNINFPVWAIHHDPDLWPEPDKFRPERFSKEEVAARDPFAFLSFGAGPRGCVGMRLAMLEIKLALARALQKFRFVTCEKTEAPLRLANNNGNQVEGGVWLKLEARSPATRARKSL